MTKIRHRRDNATNWASVNPVLGQGELAYNTTDGSFRIGDGTNHWSALTEYQYGAIHYMGVWDASGGSYPSNPEQGQYYVISVDGTISGTAYKVIDWIVYNGLTWNKVDNQIYASIDHNHTGTYQPSDADLTSIAGLTGNTGFLKKTAANTWTLDTSTYLTDISKANVEAVLTGAITSHTHAYASSTMADQTIWVDSAATGAETGVDWDNAFTSWMQAVNSLPAIINHNVVILVRDGTYSETVIIKRTVAAGTITIRGEYYWYGTNASSKTGKFDVNAAYPMYADRAQIQAGDVVWMTKWSGTALFSTPSESIIDTVASVNGTEITLTTNTAKALTTAWTYQIVKTRLNGSILPACNVTIYGIAVSGPSSGNCISNATPGTVTTVNYCYLYGNLATGLRSTSATINATRCLIKNQDSDAGDCCIIAARGSGGATTCCVLSGGYYGMWINASFQTYNSYNHIMSGIPVGVYCTGNGHVRNVATLNQATVPNSPASSSDSAYIQSW